MITDSQDYLALLYRIQDPNRQDKIIPLTKQQLTEKEFKAGTYYIEKDGKFIVAKKYDKDAYYYTEPIYSIDLNARSIDAPKFLSVEYDHNAETIYFSVDRFFDNVDLSTLFCVIQYQNANPNKAQGGYIYAVPYFDIVTKADENKMLFQWAIEGPATAYSGKVIFSIKFYRISSVIVDSVDGTSKSYKVYDYVLNTQPATSEVLHGLDILATSENYYFEATEVEAIYQAIENVRRENDLYWIVLGNDDDMSLRPVDYPPKTIDKNDLITRNIID